MKPIKLYKITITKAYMMSEQGEKFSLEPWSGNNVDYSGYDDGGNDYLLPDDYEVLECKGGMLEIYRKDDQSHVPLTRLGPTPVLVDVKKGKDLILLEKYRGAIL